MTLEFRELERVARVAPFGVQFRDRLSDSPVRQGLQVALHPRERPERRVLAQPNASGVYVVHEAPGLRRATFGRGDGAYWAAPPQSREYRCEVTDLEARFLPVSFDLRLPFRGLLTPACDSPPGHGVTLFSAPTRRVPATLAVVRAELVDAVSGAPAAWALVSADHGGAELGQGVADREGRLLLAFPYPEPARRPRTSPPQSPPETDGGLMVWDVRLRARYDARLAAQAVPDYCALRAQPEARLLEERSPPLELELTRLVLGRESVYPAPGRPRLFVAPA
jgi:hypothetical protein